MKRDEVEDQNATDGNLSVRSERFPIPDRLGPVNPLQFHSHATADLFVCCWCFSSQI